MDSKSFFPSFIFSWASGVLTGALATTLFFALRRPQKVIELPKRSQELDDLERLLHLSTLKLHQIYNHFLREMERGLTEEGGTMKMIPTYLEAVPHGNEVGSYLALDLGGTNFRIIRVILEGQGRVRTEHKKFFVDDSYKTGPGAELFDFLASCVVDFLHEFNIDPTAPIPMGFTFSFPVQQTGVNSGFLIEWTKGFSSSDVVGKDVVELLNIALSKKGLKIQVVALANDTVGTLFARCYQEAQCYIGVILGTGTNAAYIERASEIPKWKHPCSSGKMVINMEWGSFDDTRQVLPLSKYDLELDRLSPNPGKQHYEKLISGMYLGEITRLICIDLIGKGKLFGGRSSEKFETPYNFDTAFMSRIERDHSRDLKDTLVVLEELLQLGPTSLTDRQVVKRICELVGVRAARLSAIGIAGIVTKIGKGTGCVVAVDGSVFQHYPHFENRLRDALTEILGAQAENIRFDFTPDGSGIGVALAAAVVTNI